MRERCERHALALGPSGCPICRREQQAVLAPAPVEASAPVARSAPPPAASEPASTLPDSAPMTPLVTDAPERSRVGLRVPRAALLLVPLIAFGAYWVGSTRTESPAPSGPSSAAEQARGAIDSAEEDEEEEEERASLDDPSEDDGTEPASGLEEAPAVIVARTAELERTRERAQHAAQQLDAARSRVKVVLYTTERCTRCTEARSHLIAQGIYPTERDIDKDARARARHRALTRKGGLPTLEVDGKVLVGFHPERLDKAIQRAATVRLTPRKKR